MLQGQVIRATFPCNLWRNIVRASCKALLPVLPPPQATCRATNFSVQREKQQFCATSCKEMLTFELKGIPCACENVLKLRITNKKTSTTLHIKILRKPLYSDCYFKLKANVTND